MLRKTLYAVPVAMLIATGTLTAPTVPAVAQEEISHADFYQSLAQYGHWINHPRYGWVWTPANVDADWRPYSDGRWVHTAEHGFLWQSNEPFGWAVYHYGRWAFEEDYGWIWVPGRVWGPGWVIWRQGEEAVGWMPMPPDYSHTADAANYSYYEEPRYHGRWIFVHPRHFLAPLIRVVILPRHGYAGYFHRTHWSTRYITWQGRVVNRSIDRPYVERYYGRPIVSVRVNLVRQPQYVQYRGGRNDAVAVYRPVVRGAPANVTPPREAVRDYRNFRRNDAGARGQPGANTPAHATPGPNGPRFGQPSTNPPQNGRDRRDDRERFVPRGQPNAGQPPAPPQPQNATPAPRYPQPGVNPNPAPNGRDWRDRYGLRSQPPGAPPQPPAYQPPPNPTPRYAAPPQNPTPRYAAPPQNDPSVHNAPPRRDRGPTATHSPPGPYNAPGYNPGARYTPPTAMPTQPVQPPRYQAPPPAPTPRYQAPSGPPPAALIRPPQPPVSAPPPPRVAAPPPPPQPRAAPQPAPQPQAQPAPAARNQPPQCPPNQPRCDRR